MGASGAKARAPAESAEWASGGFKWQRTWAR